MWCKKLGLIAGAALISVTVFESAYYLYQTRSREDQPRGIYFLTADKPPFIFDGPLASRAPSTKVRVRGVYYDRRNIFNEFEYSYSTNDLGLVQDEDLIAGKKTILILGDSYAEGLGASPWFNGFARALTEGAARGYQAANGGMTGIGFRQFGAVEQNLARRGIDLQKLIVIFISDDMGRPPFSPRNLEITCGPPDNPCSRTSGWMQAPADLDIPSTIGRLREQDGNFTPPARPHALFIKTLMAPEPPPVAPEERRSSEESLAGLLRRYGANNVLFVHLPQKEEAGRRGPDALGRSAREMIGRLGGRIFDGFSNCSLGPADYYRHDAHPNASGYAKIQACVLAAAQTLF